MAQRIRDMKRALDIKTNQSEHLLHQLKINASSATVP